ncbi:hypothetical protein [Nitrosomonas communis]|uniref:hypothetical protein n=1 Tax=Nitrosomonas communis TaxID=44574 RepID=UPI003D2AD6F8
MVCRCRKKLREKHPTHPTTRRLPCPAWVCGIHPGDEATGGDDLTPELGRVVEAVPRHLHPVPRNLGCCLLPRRSDVAALIGRSRQLDNINFNGKRQSSRAGILFFLYSVIWLPSWE